MPKRSSSAALETPSKRSLHYTMIDLISLVRDQPLLWDMTHENYRNSTKRKEVWHKIAQSLDKDFECSDKSEQKLIVVAMIKRWKGVRDSFYHSYRRNQQRPYIYEKELQFLLNLRSDLQIKNAESLKRKLTSPENSDAESNFVENLGQNNNLADDHSQDSLICRTSEEIKLPRHKASKRLSNSELAADGVSSPSVSTSYQPLTLEAVTMHAPIDEDQSFFDSIKPAVRSLNECQKFDFRIEVLRLLKSMKEEQLN